MEELTVGSTFSSGIVRGRLVIISSVDVSRCGAGGVITVLDTVKTRGGTLVILPRISDGIVGSTGGVPNIGATRMGALGMCSVLGTSGLVVIGSTMDGVRRMCT